MVVFRGWNRRIGRSLRIVIYLACALVAVPIILRTLGPGSNNENEESHPRPSPDEVEEVPDGANVVQSKHSGDKRDWHNYQQIADDLKRVGPGEQGVAFHLPPKADMKKKNELYRQNGFNGLVSDFIALNRSIKDIRHSGCKSRLYLEKLPSVSVILPFNEELPSTLLRSVYSIINRSPKELLKEIILADDFSSHDNLKGDLDAYLQTHFHGLVKVVRASKREGLIRTRLMGARAATGDVLIFLDSHSECSYNWLPPLLEPIAQNYRTVVCPFVDVIDYETFEYRAQDEGARGAFDWELYYKRLSILPEDEKNMPEPFKSPVMAGGYFAISAKWFWEVGGYDEGLDIWGGEQYELSFKVWMCGGEMIDAPCSRVGHIYRKFAPFTNPGVGDFIGRNYKRVAVVWMDEYAEYIYKRRPHYRHLDPGDVSKQKALREQLKCKSFKWFMEKIAFDLVNKYPPVEPEDGANGEIRNVKANLCIDTRFKGQNERFELEPCVRDNPKVHSGQQNFVFTWHRDIRPQKENLCFDVSTSTNRAPVVLFACHNQKGNQEWVYRVRSKQLYHPVSELCMDCDPGNHEIFMQRCDADSQTQQWAVENVNQELLRRWGENNPEDD